MELYYERSVAGKIFDAKVVTAKDSFDNRRVA